MRVVLLVTDLELGGTPLRIARLARGLRELGVEPHVGCLARAGPVSRTLEAEGIATFACDARGVLDFLGPARRLTRHLRRIAPDLVHATLFHANVAARVVGRWLGMPVLTSTATIEVQRRWHRWGERWTSGWDRGHLVNSAALAEHVRRVFGIPAGRVFVVPPSIEPPAHVPRLDARASLGLSEGEFAVAWAGRFDPVKRLDFLLECAKGLRDDPFVFLLAGDGPLRASVARTVAREGLSERVRLLGWMHELAPLYAAADAFVLPSRTEGQPNALLAALAGGVPVLASDLACTRELAALGAPCDGLPAGSHQAWIAALRGLRADPRRRAELGRTAREWAAAHLSPHAAARATLDVYQRVLAL